MYYAYGICSRPAVDAVNAQLNFVHNREAYQALPAVRMLSSLLSPKGTSALPIGDHNHCPHVRFVPRPYGEPAQPGSSETCLRANHRQLSLQGRGEQTTAIPSRRKPVTEL